MIPNTNVETNQSTIPHQMSEAALGHENGNPVAEQMELFSEGTEVLTIQ